MKFVSHHLEPGELPEVEHVISEIEMTLMTPLKAAYYLMGSEEFDHSIVENMLFVILGDWRNFEEELIQYINEIDRAKKSKKDALIKNLAEITGADPEDIEGDREYSAKDLEQIKNFWFYIHRDEKSKHAETIEAILELAASEEGGGHADS